MRILTTAVVATCVGACCLDAQTIRGAVPANHEPHHHVAYEDAALRVLRVRVPPHDSTLLHEHDADYFWIALGPSEIVNAKLGTPDAIVVSRDRSIHYTPGHFAHVARNPGAVPFDNITVELLRPQTHPRNLCEPALAGQATTCTDSTRFAGTRERPAFATDQLRVSLATIAPGGTMRANPAARDVWLIALDTLDTSSGLAVQGAGKWRGGVYHPATSNWALRNTTSRPIEILAVLPR
jgi:hypothetical protein